MASPLLIKVCGITNRDDALAAIDAGADALGLNFFAQSPRYVRPDIAAEIVRLVPSSLWTVGVFVDETRERVTEIAAMAGLSALQFHGRELPEACRAWPHLKVIKAIHVRDAHAARLAESYAVDFILADAYVEGRPGGTGTRIAADLLTGFEARRLILAGGLTSENVAEAVHVVRPFGVDVASGVERAPGKKDWNLMRRFIANARAT